MGKDESADATLNQIDALFAQLGLSIDEMQIAMTAQADLLRALPHMTGMLRLTADRRMLVQKAIIGATLLMLAELPPVQRSRAVAMVN